MKNLNIKFILTFCWIIFGSTVLFSTLKSQLILNDSSKEFISKVFPQGWGFFTKDPQDFELSIYRIKNNKLEPIKMSNQSLKNYFGFSRSARIIGYEMSTVVKELTTNNWIKNANGNIYSHLNDSTINIKSTHLFKYLTTGEYLIKLYKPIPYAWAQQNQENYNPFSIAKIKIK